MRGVLALILLLATASVADAKPRHHHRKHRAHHGSSRFETPKDAATLPAVRYGALAPAECLAELDARQIPYTAETARGVAAPVRLTGPLHGVTFGAQVRDADRATTPYDIADCALVLALDDFAAQLETHGIVRVVHYSMYRPPPKSWPDDKIGAQHIGAMSIDAARFEKADGTALEVLKSFHGHIGARTCGDGAGPHPATPPSKELRQILCDAVAAHLFNVVLTPNFNRPHRNHFHMEVMHGANWFLVH
ncbi:MAG: extensin family protein [Deltaproteobacteria bacterium]|nr:extensin family protein [Deltaproteobacteria bacterium]